MAGAEPLASSPHDLELVATFEAALATLVADGASPTRAHVIAVSDAYAVAAPAIGRLCRERMQ